MGATRQLGEAIDDGGVSSTFFFNGRQLSAEDLSREQESTGEELARLGQALGEGVAAGLQVYEAPGSTPDLRLLTVEPGLAVNRAGQSLKLHTQINLTLSPPDTGAAASPDTAGFAACDLPASGVYFAGEDLYLLTISPSETKEGFAPVSGLGGAASCNTRMVVKGVYFRLVRLGREALSLVTNDLLRNKLAYLCFGADTFPSIYADLFGPTVEGYGLLDDLRAGGKLADCEVPLAILHLVAESPGRAGVDFVDMWSVRRRISAPSAGTIAWGLDDSGSLQGMARRWGMLSTDRRQAEGEAMFMQFQKHMDDLRFGLTTPTTVRATQYFDMLPPAGIIPLANSRYPNGFNETNFFETLTRSPTLTIEGSRVEALIRAALCYPPQAINSGVSLWVYNVRENQQASTTGTASTRPQPYLVFTTGHMAYMGDPHFDVNEWSYSNYA